MVSLAPAARPRSSARSTGRAAPGNRPVEQALQRSRRLPRRRARRGGRRSRAAALERTLVVVRSLQQRPAAPRRGGRDDVARRRDRPACRPRRPRRARRPPADPRGAHQAAGRLGGRRRERLARRRALPAGTAAQRRSHLRPRRDLAPGPQGRRAAIRGPLGAAERRLGLERRRGRGRRARKHHALRRHLLDHGEPAAHRCRPARDLGGRTGRPRAAAAPIAVRLNAPGTGAQNVDLAIGDGSREIWARPAAWARLQAAAAACGCSATARRWRPPRAAAGNRIARRRVRPGRDENNRADWRDRRLGRARARTGIPGQRSRSLERKGMVVRAVTVDPARRLLGRAARRRLDDRGTGPAALGRQHAVARPGAAGDSNAPTCSRQYGARARTTCGQPRFRATA